MALQRARLMEPVQIAATVGSVYANPASTKTYIKGILLHNTNTTSETVEIHVVPDSGGSLGTAAAANKIFKVSIGADVTQVYEFPEALKLIDTNESIQAVTTTASKVNIIVFGDKE